MAFLAPIGAALGATASSAALVGAATVVGIGSTVVSTLNTIQQGKYQAAVATRNALIQRQNADAARKAAAVEAQDKDLEAAAIMSEELAQQGASGLGIDSPSFLRRRKSLSVLAARDRLRTIATGESTARSYENSAGSFDAEAANAKPGVLTYLTGALGIGTSLISGANLAATTASRKVNRTAQSVP